MEPYDPTMGIYDLTKDPTAIIIDLINFNNGTSLAPQNFSFGLPSVPVSDIHNTQIALTALPHSGLSGSATILYNRIDFEQVPEGRNTKFNIGSALRVSDLIPAINATYHIRLTPDDYVDGLLPVLDRNAINSETPFYLVAGSNSLIYCNKVLLSIVDTGLPPNPVLLSDIIVNTVLSGLNYV
jgi:hypothetical protein